MSNKLSICRHYHPADSALDPKGPLVHTRSSSPNVQRSRQSARSYRASVTEWQESIDYIIRLSLAQCNATKFKSTKILRALSDFSRKLPPYCIVVFARVELINIDH